MSCVSAIRRVCAWRDLSETDEAAGSQPVEVMCLVNIAGANGKTALVFLN